MFISLGEIMLRFCPGDTPLRAAQQFTFSEGGGEYNVARALSRCFEIDASIITSLVDNEIGHLVQQLVRSTNVNTQHILWRDFDGIGKEVRNPLYFAERGLGHRAPKATMDRGHSAPSQIKIEDFDWDAIFSDSSVKWFHTGGIFAGLSDSTLKVAEHAMKVARKHGVYVSYDPNYRASLWQDKGGAEAARLANFTLAQYADTLFGVAPLLHSVAPPTDQAQLEQLILETAQAFPQVETIVVGQRTIQSASVHDYASTFYQQGKISTVTGYQNIQVLDRIGSGDAFAAGYIAAILTQQSTEFAAQQGCATAALTMSTPGDAVLVSKQDVLALTNQTHFSESR